MITAPEHAARVVDGRTVVDDLSCRLGVLPGEVDLVAQHLLDTLDALLGAGSYTPICSARMAEHGSRRGGEDTAGKR